MVVESFAFAIAMLTILLREMMSFGFLICIDSVFEVILLVRIIQFVA